MIRPALGAGACARCATKEKPRQGDGGSRTGQVGKTGGMGSETFSGFGKVADFAKTHQKIGDRSLRRVDHRGDLLDGAAGDTGEGADLVGAALN